MHRFFSIFPIIQICGFDRLKKKMKSGKIECDGFCSPEKASETAFVPWVSQASGEFITAT